MDSGVLNLLVNILEPTGILDGHLLYRDRVRIRVEVEPVGSTFKRVVLVHPGSIHLLQNYLSDPSHLILSAIAYCASCVAMHVPDARRRCDPPTFLLPPSIKWPIEVLMSFVDSNTRFSQIAAFDVPRHDRRPSYCQGYRCDNESLMYVFSLIPSFRY